MQNLVFTQLSIPEVRQLFREELENYFAANLTAANQTEPQAEFGGVDLAVAVTGLAKQTIYGLCFERKIPHSKKGKKLYFSRAELVEWIAAGRRKTTAEIETEAATFINSNKRKGIAANNARNK